MVKKFVYPYPHPYTGYAEFCVSVSRVSVFFGTLPTGALIQAIVYSWRVKSKLRTQLEAQVRILMSER